VVTSPDLFYLICILTIYFRGLLFGLSEEQSKGAITTACRFLLIKAGEYVKHSDVTENNAM
jgi:hypothetical protein